MRFSIGKKKILLVFGIALVVCLTILAIPNGAIGQEKVTIEYFHWGGWQVDMWDNAMAEFEQLHPNIDMQQKIVLFDHYWGALAAAILAGEAPSCFNTLPGGILVGQIRRGEVLDLKPLIDDEWRAAYCQAAMDVVTEDGFVGTLTFAMNGMMVWYRKPIFEKNGFDIPITMDELKGIAQKLRDQGVIPLTLTTVKTERTAELFLPFAHSLYPELTLEANQKKRPELWLREEFVDVFQTIHDYMITDKIAIEGCNGLSDLEAERPFAVTGDAAMLYMGNWHTRPIREMNPEGYEDFGVFPIPPVKPWSRPLTCRGVAVCMSIWSQSKHVKETAEWMRWCTFNVQDDLIKMIGLVPTGPTVYSESELEVMAKETNNHLLMDFYAAISGRTAYGIRKHFTDPDAEEALHAAIQGMLSDELTPREAWSEAASRISQVIK
jgi:ABC-type glycerol-3-phosphate transport system substrate-binding protein